MTSTRQPEAASLQEAPSVQSSIEIDAPIEQVWEVVTDLEAFPEAIDWVYEAWSDDETLDEGSVYFERGKPGLRTATYRWMVTACDPPHGTVHYHRSGELEAELELTLEPIDDGRTRYTQRMRFRTLPAFRPLGYVLERTLMRRRMQRDFDRMILPNFKRIAESRAVTA
jgi:uncharacterized protein YndB with AHSA1/START domain